MKRATIDFCFENEEFYSSEECSCCNRKLLLQHAKNCAASQLQATEICVKSELSDYKYLIYKEMNGILKLDRIVFFSEIEVGSILASQKLFEDGTYKKLLSEIFTQHSIEVELVEKVLEYLRMFFDECGE